MNRTPLLIAAMLLSSIAAAQNFPAVLRVTGSSCSGLRYEQADLLPTLTWSTPTTAVVKVTILFYYGVSASVETPQAHLDGTKLNICYNLVTQATNPNVTPTCLFPRALEFTISGIPQGTYEPYVAICGSGG